MTRLPQADETSRKPQRLQQIRVHELMELNELEVAVHCLTLNAEQIVCEHHMPMW